MSKYFTLVCLTLMTLYIRIFISHTIKNNEFASPKYNLLLGIT